MADRQVLYHGVSGEVHWDPGDKILEMKGEAFTSIAEHRAIMEICVQLVKEKRATKLLVDAVNMGSIPAEELVWTETDWMPRLIKSGLKVIAVVMPKSLAAHMTVDKIAQRQEGQQEALARRFFGSMKEGREWLKSQ